MVYYLIKSQVVNDSGRCIENNTIWAHDQCKSRERLQDKQQKQIIVGNV